MPRYVITLAFTTELDHSVTELKAAVEATLETFNLALSDELTTVTVRSVDED